MGSRVIGKGVAAGDKVVIDGQYRLTDGASIRSDAPDTERNSPAVAQPQSPHNQG